MYPFSRVQENESLHGVPDVQVYQAFILTGLRSEARLLFRDDDTGIIRTIVL